MSECSEQRRGQDGFTSTAQVVVTGLSNCLTGFHEPPSPSYRQLSHRCEKEKKIRKK